MTPTDPTPFRTPSYAEEALADALEREKRTDPTPYTPTDEDRIRIEVCYSVRTATAYGYARGAHATPYGDSITREIKNGTARVMAILAARDARVRAEAVAPVLALHTEVIVWEMDSANGTWVYGEDDERVVIRRLCDECSSEDSIRAVEDGEWTEDYDPESVPYPCPTVRAASIEQETQP